MTDPTLPEWYATTDSERDAVPHSTGRRRAISVRRALAHIGEALALELASPVCGKSWLARVEARMKVVGALLLIFACTFVHSLGALAAMLGVILVLALSIRMPLRSLARVWLGVPLFSLAIVLPAVTNLVTPGKGIFTLLSLGHTVRIWQWTLPASITITDAGIVVAARFLLRSIDCVTLSYVLIATTDHAALLNALRRLGMPRMFGMVLTMAHRYLAVLLRAAEEIHLAKISRTISAGSAPSEQRWAAAGIGILFRRSHRLACEVHNAMASRGYNGDLRVRFRPGIYGRDVACLAGAVALGGLLIAMDCVWFR